MSVFVYRNPITMHIVTTRITTTLIIALMLDLPTPETTNRFCEATHMENSGSMLPWRYNSCSVCVMRVIIQTTSNGTVEAIQIGFINTVQYYNVLQIT